MMPYPATPINEVLAMYDYYRQGHSSRQTAEKFGVSNTTVRASFRRMGLPVRNKLHGIILRMGCDRRETAAMFADLKAGMNKSQIGRKYGISRTAVRRRLLAAGYIQRAK